MLLIFLTFKVSQDETSWLNDDAPLNTCCSYF
jgi:hypothetical protein